MGRICEARGPAFRQEALDSYRRSLALRDHPAVHRRLRGLGPTPKSVTRTTLTEVCAEAADEWSARVVPGDIEDLGQCRCVTKRVVKPTALAGASGLDAAWILHLTGADETGGEVDCRYLVLGSAIGPRLGPMLGNDYTPGVAGIENDGDESVSWTKDLSGRAVVEASVSQSQLDHDFEDDTLDSESSGQWIGCYLSDDGPACISIETDYRRTEDAGDGEDTTEGWSLIVMMDEGRVRIDRDSGKLSKERRRLIGRHRLESLAKRPGVELSRL